MSAARTAVSAAAETVGSAIEIPTPATINGERASRSWACRSPRGRDSRARPPGAPARLPSAAECRCDPTALPPLAKRAEVSRSRATDAAQSEAARPRARNGSAGATNRFLNMIRDRDRDGDRRRRPAAGLPFIPPPPTRTDEVTWLEPYPDELLRDTQPEPEARFELTEAVGLAFITALQRLPVTQRTVLVVCDVLASRSSEVADMLDTTEATVNSALQRRARSALAARMPPARARSSQALPRSANWPRSSPTRSGSATWTLAHGRAFRPPGARVCLIPTRANAAPAFGHYQEQEAGSGIARGLGVCALVLEGHRIARLTRFGTPELLPRLGLPLTAAAPLTGHCSRRDRPRS